MKIVAIDIGGTAIKHGFFENSVLKEHSQVETNALNGGEYIFATICNIIEQYEKFEYIAISTAGQVNPKEGYIIYANENIPNYTGMRLKDRLQEKYNVKTFVENDVNAAALGEAYFGAGKKEENFLCLTYGTGIGGAIVQNKQIYYGSSYSVAEFGSIITHSQERIKTWGFYDGSYEKYASATALVNEAMKLSKDYNSGKIIFENYLKDVNLKNIIDNWFNEVMLGLITLIHIFNPSCIILGGGIMAQEYIISKIQNEIYTKIMPNFKNVKIINASLQNKAAMYGAIVPVIYDK